VSADRLDHPDNASFLLRDNHPMLRAALMVGPLVNNKHRSTRETGRREGPRPIRNVS